MKPLMWLVTVGVLGGIVAVCVASLSSSRPVTGAPASPGPRVEPYENAMMRLAHPPLLPLSALQPSAVTKETSYDFGIMDVDTPGQYSFKIRNEGKGDLVLKKGETTCECTISSLEEGGIVLPGKEVGVKLAWTTKSGSVEDYRETAAIMTNDRQNRTIKFVVKGKVRDYLMVFPRMLSFPSVNIADKPKELVVVASAAKGNFQITKIESSTPHITTDKKPGSPESVRKLADLSGFRDLEHAWDVDVVLQPTMPRGRFYEKLTFYTDVPDRKPYELIVFGKVTGSINFFAPAGVFDRDKWMVTLDNVPTTTGRKVSLTMIATGVASDIKPRVVGLYPDFLKVNVSPGREGAKFRSYQLEIEVPPGTPPCNYYGNKSDENGKLMLGEILLETDLPEEKLLRVLAQFAVEK